MRVYVEIVEIHHTWNQNFEVVIWQNGQHKPQLYMYKNRWWTQVPQKGKQRLCHYWFLSYTSFYKPG